MNGPRDSENLFVFGSAPITPAANPFNNWDNRHTWQLSCCRFLHNLAEHRGNFPESIANEAECGPLDGGRPERIRRDRVYRPRICREVRPVYLLPPLYQGKPAVP